MFLLFLHLKHSESHPIWFYLDWEPHSTFKPETGSVWKALSELQQSHTSLCEESTVLGWAAPSFHLGLSTNPGSSCAQDQSSRTQVAISLLCHITPGGAPWTCPGLGGDQECCKVQRWAKVTNECFRVPFYCYENSNFIRCEDVKVTAAHRAVWETGSVHLFSLRAGSIFQEKRHTWQWPCYRPLSALLQPFVEFPVCYLVAQGDAVDDWADRDEA